MSQIVPGKEIIKLFKLDKYTLFRYLQSGLPVYDDNAKRITDSNYFDPAENNLRASYKINSSILTALAKGCEDALANEATQQDSSPIPIFKTPSDEQAEKKALLKMIELWFNIGEVREFIKNREEMYMKPDNDTNVPAYMDKKNKYFCIELKVAIEAWTALFQKGGYVEGKKSPKNQILQWLNESCPDRDRLSNHAIDRIATMINPKPGGGAPKTEDY